MYKFTVASLLISAASAFSPAQVGKASTALAADFSQELGAQVPTGFYDPLFLLSDADQERFDKLRYVELKHGRIAQLAFLGQITTRAGIHLSGNIDYSSHSFDSYPNGVAALFGPDAIPKEGLLQMIAFVGFLELFVMKDSANGAAPGDFPGDFRNGALDFGWDKQSDAWQLEKRAVELNNGRAAMMGILGLMVHENLGNGASLPFVGSGF